MPLDGEGSVTYKPTSNLFTNSGGVVTGSTPLTSGGGNPTILIHDAGATNEQVRVENIDEVLLTNSGVSINDLRRSIRLQEWLEKNARGGGRYVEQIMSHFGERSPDARLQRPEFLGGGKNPVVISEVLSTVTASDPDTAEEIPQANMAGHGISFGRTNGFTRKFVEHGWILGIMSVMPRTGYQQGINRMFTRFDRFDYYWPEFAQIGEQEVLNKEVYINPLVADSTLHLDGTFGYQSRYAEYKYTPSTTHGQFKSSLLYWTLNRVFASQPSLNGSFVESDPSARIFAILPTPSQAGIDQAQLMVQVYNKVDALRPMPYFGTPTI